MITIGKTIMHVRLSKNAIITDNKTHVKEVKIATNRYKILVSQLYRPLNNIIT